MMQYEIIYPDDQVPRRLTRDQALQEIREYRTHIEGVQTVEQEWNKQIFIAVWPSDSGYHDWITISSLDFVSHDAALEFIHEAGLIDLLKP